MEREYLRDIPWPSDLQLRRTCWNIEPVFAAGALSNHFAINHNLGTHDVDR